MIDEEEMTRYDYLSEERDIYEEEAEQKLKEVIGDSDTQEENEDMEDYTHFARIKVVGVGGAGNNAVNRMINFGVKSAEFFALNTDRQALSTSLCKYPIQIGSKRTRGLGAGADPKVGEESAIESEKLIEEYVLKDTDLLIITAGMGGGTGTGAAPIVAKLAKEKGILTIAIVTKPFVFEGIKRLRNAEKGIEELKKYVDTLVVIPNEKLREILRPETTFDESLKYADDVLRQGIQGIADLISTNAMINLDFADVKTIMKGQGLAHMGLGVASGEGRMLNAVRQAVSSPLLETNIEGATGLILNVMGGKDMTLGEVSDAATLVQNVLDPSANIIFGAGNNGNTKGEVTVTIIATGFKSVKEKEVNILSTELSAYEAALKLAGMTL